MITWRNIVVLSGLLSATVCLLPWSSPAADKPSAADSGELFLQKVRPLLLEKCLVCHGKDAKKLQGGLDLRTRAGLLKGGDSGEPAVVPGEPDKSPLYVAVTRKNDELVMPPKDNDKLTPEQVDWLRQWIAGGAPWPEAPATETVAATDPWNTADGVVIKTSGGRSPEWTNRKYKPEEIWAYQPIRRPEVPKVQKLPVHNPLDAFVAARLEARGITQPAPRADKRTLIRRTTFDLTGLPPTPEEVDAFLADQTADSFARLIDRLLASRHYGEQQARYWLDVVRYADTSGFSNDFERPHAWRYRDYVVRSFNADKPFDRFVIEQLAGDELDPGDPELRIAVGFLRLGPWEHTGMTVAALTRQQFLDDVTHSVGVSFLGQGLRCASCHDHKFDPLPTKDYYRLQAVFAATQFAEREAPFLSSENTATFPAGRAVVKERLADLEARQTALRQKADDAVAAFLKERGLKSVAELPVGQRPAKDYLGYTVGLSKTDLSLRKTYEKGRAYLERELKRFEPHAFSVYSGPPNGYQSNRPLYGLPAQRAGAIPVVHILAGGSLEAAGEAVKPGVLSAMHGANDLERPTAWNSIPAATEGRRLALAQWIASPTNTLTARVLVNRVWQQHFGRGLVATPNNFGKMGARPTHPELLDWLATWFIEHGWSLKRLHQLILTSATYQQGGSHPQLDRLREIDARNDLLAYYTPRRLAAEELRDALLAVSGELNRDLGGPGVFPEINWEVAFQPRHIMGGMAPAYLPSTTSKERNRRTIYTYRYRTLADPFLEVFNRPGSEMSCERRDETTVTPQVFALFHSAFAGDRALAFAAALEKQAPTGAGRIERAFRLVYGRAPAADELQACVAHLTRMIEHHRNHPPREVALPTSVRRSMVEELTGETVSWVEELPSLKHYQRDLQPWQVGPETRALADVCLVLMNSNEFLHVR